MKDSDKIQTQLIKELDSARKRLAQLEESGRRYADFTEMTALKRTEEEQITARKQLRYLLATCPAVIYASQPLGNYRITFISENVRTELGHNPLEFIRHPTFWLDHVHPEDRAQVLAERPHVLDQDYCVHEYRFQHRDGRWRWIHDRLRLVRDAEGKPVEIVGYWVDITERRWAEEVIIQAAEQWERTFDAVPDLMVLLDTKHRILRVNKAMAVKLGLPAQELVGRTCYEVVHGTNVPPPFCPHAQLLTDGQAHMTQIQEKRWGGDFVVSVFPIRSSKGELIASIHVARDITEHKRAQDALVESAERLATLVSHIPGAVYRRICDPDWTECFLSDFIEDISGYPALDFINNKVRSYRSIIYPKDRSMVQETVLAAVSQKKPYVIEYRITHTDGDIRWVYEKGQGVFGSQNELLWLDGALFDITDRKRGEEELRKHREHLEDLVAERTAELRRSNKQLQVRIAQQKRIERELAQERQNLERIVQARTQELSDSLRELKETNLRLEEANQHKSHFLSSMSHELRTPLNAILGFADLLREQYFGPLNEVQLSYVSELDSSGKHLLNLINDLLDLTKIDAGRMELELEELHPSEVVDVTVAMMKTLFRKKRLTVKTFTDPAVTFISVDRRKCKQIMLNLLSNAVKYTPKGGRIGVRVTKHDEAAVRIEVSDTGIGIKSEEHEKIFSEFYQSNQARDEQLGGTGIGLSLTRRLVELHGGQIGLESQPGKGSTFWFTLPLKKVVPEPHNILAGRADGNQTEIRGRRILVAEDNETNLAAVTAMLSIHSHDVIVARNGREAVDLAQSQKPELILMDLRMPEMDGIEATRRLRTMPAFAEIPIIALTAIAGAKTEESCAAAGFTDHVVKPIQCKELFGILRNYLKKAAPRPQDARKSHTHSRQPTAS